MIKLLWILLILTIFSSCATYKVCTKRFPCLPAGRDSVYIETLDTVKITIPGDSMLIEVEVPCDDFELKTQNSKLLNDLKVVNGRLQQLIRIKPDTIYSFKTNTVTKTVYVPKKEIEYRVPKFYKVTAWFSGIVILILGLYFYLRRKL